MVRIAHGLNTPGAVNRNVPINVLNLLMPVVEVLVIISNWFILPHLQKASLENSENIFKNS